MFVDISSWKNRKVGQNEEGRRVLLAGRGRSPKKKKDGEMTVTRIEDLIARMGGRKRKNEEEISTEKGKKLKNE